MSVYTYYAHDIEGSPVGIVMGMPNIVDFLPEDGGFLYQFCCDNCGNLLNVIPLDKLDMYEITCANCEMKSTLINTMPLLFYDNIYTVDKINTMEDFLSAIVCSHNMSFLYTYKKVKEIFDEHQVQTCFSNFWSYRFINITSNLNRSTVTRHKFLNTMDARLDRFFVKKFKTSFEFRNTLLKPDNYADFVYNVISRENILYYPKSVMIQEAAYFIKGLPLTTMIPARMFSDEFHNIIGRNTSLVEKEEPCDNYSSLLKNIKTNGFVECSICGYLEEEEKATDTCIHCRVVRKK